MGTNFYVEGDPTCDNDAHTKSLHIGKSSLGWKFAFRTYDELGLTSWAAWQEFLRRGPMGMLGRRERKITDEYDRTLTLAEFAERVTVRTSPGGIGSTEPPWCRVTPSPECIARGFGGRWTPPEGDPPDEFHDPEGFDFSRRSFS